MSVTTSSRFLPDALSLNTFSYLRKEDLVICGLISKHWGHLTSQNQLWEIVARRIFTGPFSEKCNYKLFLQQESKKINTNEEIIDRIQKFINKISLGKNGRLLCSLEVPKGAIISLEIIGARDKITDAHEITEHWIALNAINDPTAIADQSERYESRSIYTTRLDETTETTLVSSSNQNKSILAILKFPKLSDTHISPIPMEYRIASIMEKKVQELSDQLYREKKRKFVANAGALLGGFIICGSVYLKNTQTLRFLSV